MTIIHSATGPVDTTQLGNTLMHEHIVIGSPQVYANWPQTFDRNAVIELSARKLKDVKARGITTLVDLTTVDLGRDVELVRAIANAAGVTIIVATGIWWQPPPYFSWHDADYTADLFVTDIEQGVAGTGIRCGIIKCATDTAGVTPEIEMVLRASARAHRRTGVPISTHTDVTSENGTAQQDVFESEGVDLSRVVIGHSGDSTDLVYLHKLMDRGSYIGMDRFGLDRMLPFEKRVATVAALCREGFAGRIVLSHDASCIFDWAPEERIREFAPNWHFRHIVDDVLPALREQGVSQAQIDQMTTGNPRAIFEKQGAY